MKKQNILQIFCRMLPKLAGVSPGVFAVWQLLAVAHGLSYGLIAPITQRFFDRAAGFAAHEMEISAVISGLVVLSLAHVVKQALNGIANFMHMMYYRKAEGVMASGVHEKLSKLPPACFEDTGMLDIIDKALQGKNEAVWATGTIVAVFSFYLPYFLSMAIYLFRVRPLLVISLALVFAPTIITQFLRAKVFAKTEDLSAPVRREFDYYESCMTGREYYKETRILGAFSYFRGLYADAFALLNKLSFRAAVKSDLAELGMTLLSLGGYAGILLLLMDSLLKGQISVGAFAAIFGSVDQLFSIIKELFVGNFSAVARALGLVRNYLALMDMQERGGAGADMDPDPDADIALRNVSFTYPGAGEKAVDGVSISIRPGETVAIVGENGSGKTTLVRLITGLYAPDEGAVIHGGVDTGTASMAALFGGVSAVFQRYGRYQMTLRDNIAISDMGAAPEDCRLGRACAQAGMDAREGGFPGGYETMLSREFDGVDLSGGQWQRVAIARGFFRDHRLIVLDEPTAAIDPIEETKVYNRFAEISRGKTAVIVTHRLGSVKLADRIFVMKQGRLTEQGTHEELLAAGGEYARLYRAQEQWYVK